MDSKDEHGGVISVVNFLHVEVKFLHDLPVECLERHRVSVSTEAQLFLAGYHLGQLLRVPLFLLLLLFLFFVDVGKGLSTNSVLILDELSVIFGEQGLQSLLLSLEVAAKNFSNLSLLFLFQDVKVIVPPVEGCFGAN